MFGTRKRVMRTLLVGVVLYGAFVGALYSAQRMLIFRNSDVRLAVPGYLPDMKQREIVAPYGTRLVMHGTWDAVIPFHNATRLFDAAADPKWHRWFERGRHYDLWQRGAQDSIAEFMGRYFPGDAAS